MIKINLLPVEKRKAERTPLPRFFLILSTAAVAAVLILSNVWIYIQIIAVERDIEIAKQELASLAKDVEKHDRLVAEHAFLDAKLNQIKALVSRDVELGWWRAVDALWTVISAHPKVWIDDFRAVDGRTSGADIKRVDPASNEVPPYAVSMRCHVAGNEVAEMTQFRKALKDHPVLQETLTTVNFNVDWSVVAETGFDEKHSITFNVTLFAPHTPPKRKPAPSAAAAGPGGGPAPVGAPSALPKETVK